VRSRTLLLCTLVAALTASLVHADAPGLQMLEMGTGPHGGDGARLGGSRTDWLQTVKRLRDRYHCVMVELPGQGASPLPDPFSLQVAAQALDDVVAKQKPDSTIVVGDGFGGMLALLAASAHPEHLRGVMLIDTPIKSPIPVSDQERDQMAKFIDENYQQFSSMVFSKMGRDSIESARLYAMMVAVPPATVKAYLRHILGADANRDLKGLKVPLALAFSEKGWKAGASAGTVMHAFASKTRRSRRRCASPIRGRSP